MPQTAQELLDEATAGFIPKETPAASVTPDPAIAAAAAAAAAATVSPPPPAPVAPKIDVTTIPKELLPGGTPPEPKKEVKPIEVNDTTLEAYEKGLPEAQRAGFNAAVRVTMKAQKARIAELEAAHKQVAPADAKVVEELNAKLAKEAQDRQAIEDRLGRYDLAATRAFQTKFLAPEAALTQQAKDILKGFDVEDAVLDEALAAKGADLIKVLKDKATPAMAMLQPLVVQLQQLKDAKETALTNHRTILSQMQAQNQNALLEQTAKARETLYHAALEKRTQAGDFLLKELPGNDSWNTSVVGPVKQMVKALMETSDPNMQAEAFVLAAQAPVLMDSFIKANAKIAELQAEIAALQGLTPELGGGTPPGSATPVQLTSQDAAGAAMDIVNLVTKPK